MNTRHPILNRLATVGHNILGSLRRGTSPRSNPKRRSVHLNVEALEAREVMSTTSLLTTATYPTVMYSAQQERINWLQSNLYDTNLRNLAVTDYSRDNALTRNDMIGLMSQAANNDNSVTNSELHDLQLLVTNGSYLNMPASVQNLASKIVNGSPANEMGNLQAGSSGTLLNLLSSKWFVGADHPAFSASGPHTSYQAFANDSLFGPSNTISDADPTQGAVQDSYFLSALSELALKSPNTIRNMFTDNGDGTFTVQFMNGGAADYVTVDRLLPVDSSNHLLFAGVGQTLGDANIKLWAPLLEKAYVQVNQEGWLGGNGNTYGHNYSYSDIGKVGFAGNVFAQLTGSAAGTTANALLDFNTLVQAIDSFQLVTLCTPTQSEPPVIDGFQVGTDQEFAVVGHSGTYFTLFNPATGLVQQVSWGTVYDLFDTFDTGVNPSAPSYLQGGLIAQATKGATSIGAALPDSGTGTVSPQQAWIQATLFDTKLSTMAVADYVNHHALTRNDVLGLFQQAVGDNLLSKSEFHDLQALVANGAFLGMPDYVLNLANKVVNGDLANVTTMHANDHWDYKPPSPNADFFPDKMLVNQWFLGTNRPVDLENSVPDWRYKLAQGSLFGPSNTISYKDITQGFLGDCYFLSAVADVANASPSTIRNMFIDNGDGTFTIRFMKNGTADYVTVDRYLMADQNGLLVLAGKGQSVTDPNVKLWVALLEKAYAQLNASGWIGQDGTNNYGNWIFVDPDPRGPGINGGNVGTVLPQLTGLWGNSGNPLDRAILTQEVQAGLLVSLNTPTFGTTSNPVPTKMIDGFTIVGDHSYSVVGYNATTGLFTLFNPHGINATDSTGLLQNVSWGNIYDIFTSFDVGGTPASLILGTNLPLATATTTATPVSAPNGTVSFLFHNGTLSLLAATTPTESVGGTDRNANGGTMSTLFGNLDVSGTPVLSIQITNLSCALTNPAGKTVSVPLGGAVFTFHAGTLSLLTQTNPTGTTSGPVLARDVIVTLFANDAALEKTYGAGELIPTHATPDSLDATTLDLLWAEVSGE